ncbi:alpha/beta fold hydrolase [Marinisporobacter balticus]|uniref:Pimeloyl-[acyl-carrier protein] methyl ester esterase n=1 Tax=Marinisporobacter balticus TaxID=2018667 RepID=A0A4R2KQ74_9FIRM|nr:alpha/beta hydrolase [Marinisporobacter balticus]TCO72268.1 pimeloyl-[acyl-carrier protein] methyl ester esterase [Marinisporobacter balticus]
MKKILIILSGWAVDKLVWKPITDLLCNDFEIILVDWDHMISIDAFKQNVINLINEKEIQHFSLIGWSLGALVSMDLVVSYPSKIEHLILFNPTSKFTQDKNYVFGWHKKIVLRMIDMLKKDPEKTLNTFYKNLFSDVEIKNGEYDLLIEKIQNLNKKYCIESLCLGLEYLMMKDFREKVKSIHKQVLIIHGDQDMICPVEAGTYINNYIKKSEFIILRETGHMPFFTKSKECYQMILEYVNSI